MKTPSVPSDGDLLALMPDLVRAERASTATVIEHLVEIDCRRLFADEACASLLSYCRERQGYSEDEASKRTRVTRSARKYPQVLEELRSGAIHMTGLVLLGPHLTADNHVELLSMARGQSKRVIERLLAARFPKPNIRDGVHPSEQQLELRGTNGSGRAVAANQPAPECGGGVRPLSASTFAIQFTGSASLVMKLEQALTLVSHAMPHGDLGAVFERALDALIEKETERRLGSDKPRKSRGLKAGSRRVPLAVARAVWERGGFQCAFVDHAGRRCSARRFLTIEHRHPFTRGGPPTLENLCLYCVTHNLHSARKAFGDKFIDAKIAQRRARSTESATETELAEDDAKSIPEQPSTSPESGSMGTRTSPAPTRRLNTTPTGPYAEVWRALRTLGFRERDLARIWPALHELNVERGRGPLLRAALQLLVP